MKKLTYSLLSVFSATVFGFTACAQTDATITSHAISIQIPKVALLDFEGTSTFTLAPEVPIEAGNPLNFTNANNNSLWLNYSSIVSVNSTRTVTAKITSGTVPAGVNIKLVAGAVAGAGAGTHGTAVANGIILDATDKAIITGIGSSYTGDGTSNGHQLTYSLSLKDDEYASLLIVNNEAVTVSYTLSDN